MISRLARHVVRFAAMATVLVAGTACIEGNGPGGANDGVVGPTGVGRDPAAVAEVVGLVRDQQTGAAIPGARIFVGGLETFAGTDGSYRLSGIPQGVVNLQAQGAGYQDRLVLLPLAAGPNTFQMFLTRAAP